MPCANHPEVLEGLNSCTRCAKKFCGDCLVELKGGSFCAACKSEEVKDIQSGVGDAKELVLATIGRRFAAQFIDGLLAAVVWVPIAFALGIFQSMTNASSVEAMSSRVLLFQLLIAGVFLAYEGILLQVRGQTVGKMALGIKVVTPDGRPIAAWQAWLRPLVRMGIASIKFLALVDYIPALFMKQKTCIHDLAAKTRVVKIS